MPLDHPPSSEDTAEAVDDTNALLNQLIEFEKENAISNAIANETAKNNKAQDQDGQKTEFNLQKGLYFRQFAGASAGAIGMAVKMVAGLDKSQRSQQAFQMLAGTTAIISSLASVYNVGKNLSDVFEKSHKYEDGIRVREENAALAERTVRAKHSETPSASPSAPVV